MNRKLVMKQEVKSIINSFITFKMMKRNLPFKREIYPYLERRCTYQVSQKIGELQESEKTYFSNLIKREYRNSLKTTEGAIFKDFQDGIVERSAILKKSNLEIYQFINNTKNQYALDEVFHDAIDTSRLDVIKLMVDHHKIEPLLVHAHAAIIREDMDILKYLLSFETINKHEVLFLAGFSQDQSDIRRQMQALLIDMGARISSFEEKAKTKGIIFDERYDFIKNYEQTVLLHEKLDKDLSEKDPEKKTKI
jgi:hypothetical protein